MYSSLSHLLRWLLRDVRPTWGGVYTAYTPTHLGYLNSTLQSVLCIIQLLSGGLKFLDVQDCTNFITLRTLESERQKIAFSKLLDFIFCILTKTTWHHRHSIPRPSLGICYRREHSQMRPIHWKMITMDLFKLVVEHTFR